MKLSFTTLPVMDYTGEQLHRLCREHDMSVEVRMASDGSFAYEKGLPVTNLGSSICLRGYQEAQLGTAAENLRKAHDCGISAVRVFLGNFRQNYSDPANPIDRDGIVRALRFLCAQGGEIWIETHNEFSTGDVLARLLEDTACDNLGIILDILHPLEDGEKPAETWDALRTSIRHIHIKDARPDPRPDRHDWYYTPLGKGEVPVADYVRLAQTYGYDGYYSLEWESAWRAELRDVTPDIDTLLYQYRAYMEGILS